MLRALLLALSKSRIAASVAMHAPLLRAFSSRFVAGTKRGQALAAVGRLNAAGMGATVSYLGEAVTSEDEARQALSEFTAFAEEAAARRLDAHLSIKLTELGLAFDAALARRSLADLLRVAAACGTFVRIDMEDARYTAVTLELFREARRSHQNVGVVVQAYLRRSAADIDQLAREGAPVRLVKGAYREPEEVAFQSKAEVDASFLQLADAYLRAMPASGRLAIATHDERMIRGALAAARRHAVDAGALELQFLYGIRPELQRRLRDRGHAVRIYVPYGSHWYPYLMRRLAERPANTWFFLRSAVRRS